MAGLALRTDIIAFLTWFLHLVGVDRKTPAEPRTLCSGKFSDPVWVAASDLAPSSPPCRF